MTDTPAVPAGWYADTTDSSRLRYWDGQAWTDHFAPVPVVPAAAQVPVASAETVPVAAASADQYAQSATTDQYAQASTAGHYAQPATASQPATAGSPERAARRRVPTATWIVGAVLAVILLISLIAGVGVFLLMLGLIALGTGAYVLILRRPSWALLPANRAVGASVLVVGLVLAIVGGSMIGGSAHSNTTREASAPVATSATATPAPSKKPASTPKATAKSTPTPSAAAVAVPSVVGMKGDAARAAIEALGLKVDWSEVVVVAGNWTVDAQVPAAGANAVPGSKILLTVSKHADPAPAASAAPAQPAAPAVPAEYTSALKQAKSYGDNLHMSKAGIYDQLTSEYGEQFSPEAAQYAVDNVKMDWNANALATAKTYQSSMSMSPEAIRDQLTSEYGEKFTADEADYAIQHLND